MAGHASLHDGTPVTEYVDAGQGVVTWTPQHHPSGWQAQVVSQPDCAGDRPVPLAALLEVAAGVR